MVNNSQVNKEELLARLDRLLDWIKSCDTKASIVIAGVGLFLAFFSSEHIFNILKIIFNSIFTHLNFSNLLYLLFFIVAAGMFIYGFYSLIRVLTPRLTEEVQHQEGMNRDSLYFFEAIAHNNYKDFADKIKDRSAADELQDIITQIYINSKICSTKYKHYRKGIIWSSIGLSVLLGLFFIGLILVKVGGIDGV